jgi:ABC-type phosphate/phosphonate transport system substrate-binding protein
MPLLAPFQVRKVRLIWPVVLVALLLSAGGVKADDPEVVHIGMVKSIFRDVPTPVVKALTIPFGAMMRQLTGVNGQIATSDSAYDLGEKLEKGQMQLGVFHGFEFAWAQERFPKLRPLMIAVNQHRYLAVHLVTRDGSTVERFEDLKGKKVSIPQRSREHCYLFVDRHCDKQTCTVQKFFGKIVKHSNCEEALDDVVRGEIDAAIVDGLSLECYGIVKPGCMPLLKTIEKTEHIPAAVIAYREGSLSEQLLNNFRDGMMNANKDPKSRGLMSLYKLTGFEDIPDDYQEALTCIRKTYPAPAAMFTKTAEPTKVDGPSSND